jgi:hypothetical protein
MPEGRRDSPPERPDLLREALSYDPLRYAALHSSPPPDDGPPRKRRRRDLVVLAVIAAIPAGILTLVVAHYQRALHGSPGVLLVFVASWLLIVLVLAGRSVLLR